MIRLKSGMGNLRSCESGEPRQRQTVKKIILMVPPFAVADASYTLIHLIIPNTYYPFIQKSLSEIQGA